MNDYEVVVKGLRQMLLPFADRVAVVELHVAQNRDVNQNVDIALYDSFARDGLALSGVRELMRDPQVKRTVIYTWNLDPGYVDQAMTAGASGVLSKSLSSAALVSALEQIHEGRRLVSNGPPQDSQQDAEPRRNGDWPGSEAGLTQREAEMVALITSGLTNADIAKQTYLSPNSVKSYIRSAYKKIGVVRRSQAVAWGIDHGMDRQHREQLAQEAARG